MSGDRIEKHIELKAPVSRVWRALSDYREFGEEHRRPEAFRMNDDGWEEQMKNIEHHVGG
jgi:uncharacterized protein YndB with AHSA1/START domain